MNNLIQVLLSLSGLEVVEDNHWAAGSESGETEIWNILRWMLTLARVWLMGLARWEFIIIISHNCISPSSYILITVTDLTREVWFTAAASPTTRLISATHIQTGTSSILRKLISNDYNIPAFTDWPAPLNGSNQCKYAKIIFHLGKLYTLYRIVSPKYCYGKVWLS